MNLSPEIQMSTKYTFIFYIVPFNFSFCLTFSRWGEPFSYQLRASIP